jgi:hypothetical protein
MSYTMKKIELPFNWFIATIIIIIWLLLITYLP